MTLAQELEQRLIELDATSAPDSSYRAAFSTATKKPLRPGETWRSRLVTWLKQEQNRELHS